MPGETAFDAASLVTSAETAAGFWQMGILWTLLVSGESTPRDVLAPPAYAACAAAKGVVEAMTRIVARELRGRDFSRVGFQRRSTWGLQMPAGARVGWKQRWPSLREARPGGGRGKTIISFTSSGGSGLAAEQPPSAAERTTMLISGGFE